MPEFDPIEALRNEERAAQAAALAFVQACRTGNATNLFKAVDQVNASVDGWLTAMRKLIKEIPTVNSDIQEAFLSVWMRSKMLPLRVGDNRVLCDAARILLPRYRGSTVRLFRGAGTTERRRRTYGVSWSTDVAVAERFAEERRVMDCGSVLLETLAPPKAIICEIQYPEPFTQEEIETFKREHPEGETSEYHEEREYIVDRRYLNAVKVVRRLLPQ